MLLVSFWISSVVDCVCKHVHTHRRSYVVSQARLTSAREVGRACETRSYAGSSPVTTDASMPLGLVSIQAPLIFLVRVQRSCSSSSQSSRLSTSHVTSREMASPPPPIFPRITCSTFDLLRETWHPVGTCANVASNSD